jgi:hypothetical protein
MSWQFFHKQPGYMDYGGLLRRMVRAHSRNRIIRTRAIDAARHRCVFADAPKANRPTIECGPHLIEPMCQAAQDALVIDGFQRLGQLSAWAGPWAKPMKERRIFEYAERQDHALQRDLARGAIFMKCNASGMAVRRPVDFELRIAWLRPSLSWGSRQMPSMMARGDKRCGLGIRIETRQCASQRQSGVAVEAKPFVS